MCVWTSWAHIYEYLILLCKIGCDSAICVHLLTRIGPIFVDLVDDQCEVSVYHEAFNVELDGYTKSVETCFILRGVVGS